MRQIKNFKLYLKNSQINALDAYLKRDLIIDKELGCNIYPNATILPTTDNKWPPKGGVRDNNSKWIINSTSWHAEDTTKLEGVTYIDQDVVYIGALLGIYGHTFTDNLSKIWYVLFSKEYNPNIKIAYTAKWGGLTDNLPSYLKEFFELLNLDVNKFLYIKSPTQFRNVYIPDDAFEHRLRSIYIHPVMFDMYSKMIENALKRCPASETTPKKIYYTRTKFNTTGWLANGLRDIGEKTLEKLFKREGYTIISPERMTISQQISLLQGCDYFATTEGSISHNSVFLRASAKCIILRKVDYINTYQMALSIVNSVDTALVDAHSSYPILKNERPNVGPFFMCITPQLEEFFGRKIFRFPLWIRPSWLFYYFIRSNNRVISLFRSSFIQNMKRSIMNLK